MIFQRMEISTFVMQGDLDAIQLLRNENIISILFITLVLMIIQNTFT